MAIGTTAAILGGAALSAGATVIGAKSASKAGKAQAAAATEAGRLQQQQFMQTRADLAPWRQVGASALNQYAQMLGVPAYQPTAPGMGGIRGRLGLIQQPTGATGVGGPAVGGGPDRSAFYTSPGYQFRLGEGIKAVERSAAARGSLQSGAAMKAVQRYGEGLAAQEYGNYISRLGGLAGMGQSAAAQTGAFGAQAAAGQAGAIQQAGAARASGYLGVGQAIGQGLSGLGGFLGYASGGYSNPPVPASTFVPSVSQTPFVKLGG